MEVLDLGKAIVTPGGRLVEYVRSVGTNLLFRSTTKKSERGILVDQCGRDLVSGEAVLVNRSNKNKKVAKEARKIELGTTVYFYRFGNLGRNTPKILIGTYLGGTKNSATVNVALDSKLLSKHPRLKKVYRPFVNHVYTDKTALRKQLLDMVQEFDDLTGAKEPYNTYSESPLQEGRLGSNF